MAELQGDTPNYTDSVQHVSITEPPYTTPRIRQR
jgi:hypothetical protein